MKVIYSLTEENVIDLHELYQGEWWTKGRTLIETKSVVDGSQINVGFVDERNVLVAYARVLTDFTFKAMVFDVIVSKGYRGKGLGDKLIERIKNHEKLSSVKCIELYCLPEMFEFYSRHSFSSDVSGVKLMRQSDV